ELLDRVRHGAVDIATIRVPSPPQEVGCVKLTDTVLRVALHPGHRLAKQKQIDLAELAHERFVLTRNRQSRLTVWDYFDKHNFVPKVAIEADTMATVLTAVRGSRDFVTVLPIVAPQAAAFQGVAFVDLRSVCHTEGSFLIWRANDLGRPKSEWA